jgi:hypothetical protein
MGWKGNVRAVQGAYKRAKREGERQERENIKEQKQYEKAQQLECDQKEYEEYQEYYNMLKSLHGDCSKPVDWNEILNSKEPNKPRKYKKHENNAKQEKDNFKPGLIDKIFKRAPKKIIQLDQQISNASVKDKQAYEGKVTEWEGRCKEWKEKVKLANKIIEGDPETKLKVIEMNNPFSEISGLGTEVVFVFTEDSPPKITVKSHGEEVIPTELKTLLQSGKLSIKKMPKGQYNELYQDHVCSVALRVANETFSILPDEFLIVNVVDKLLNTKTGHKEELAILSVGISRETLGSINLKRIDPSDCMENFVHNMSFKKLKGFTAVDQLEPKNFDEAKS